MMMFGIGPGLDSLQYPLDPETFNVFRWKEDSLYEIYDRFTPIIEETNRYIIDSQNIIHQYMYPEQAMTLLDSRRVHL
jgi:hypothetical protein